MDTGRGFRASEPVAPVAGGQIAWASGRAVWGGGRSVPTERTACAERWRWLRDAVCRQGETMQQTA